MVVAVLWSAASRQCAARLHLLRGCLGRLIRGLRAVQYGLLVALGAQVVRVTVRVPPGADPGLANHQTQLALNTPADTHKVQPITIGQERPSSLLNWAGSDPKQAVGR